MVKYRDDSDSEDLNTPPEPTSDTEVPLKETIMIVLAFMFFVYVVTQWYERSVVSSPYGKGTENKPTGIEDAIGAPGGGPQNAPWK